jgi:arylsulfatase A-like enzyme
VRTGSRRGLTRRGVFKAGGAGAAALGLAACGDDYFEPSTDHDSDAPNFVLIFTDSTRADYIGAYNHNQRNKTPNLDALAKDSLKFSLAVPEAMPTGPARRALLTGIRSFPYRNYVPTKGLPVGPGWIPIPDFQPIVTETMGEAGIETAYCTDNPFLVGPRFANFRRTLDWARPSYSQGAYRFLNKPFKRPAPRSSIDRYLLPELSDSVEVGRLRSMVGWNSIYRDSENDYPTARVFRSGINLVDDLKKRRPFFLGVDSFDPHEPLDAPRVYQLTAGSPKGIEREQGITPIQPFETPYSWVVNVDVDDETIERVRELYAAEITFVDEWIGRLMNRLADENLLDETVVCYMSDHGLTLGEDGVLGKHGARAQWHIYHVPCMIRHPEGKLAGETSDFFASTHDVSRTALSFMGIRAPGIMNGEDLSVIFEGGQPSPRPRFTSCYDNYVLCGDRDWFFISDSEGRRKRLYDKHADPLEHVDVADQHPEIVDRMWRVLEDEAGGTLPQFAPSGPKGVIGG